MKARLNLARPFRGGHDWPVVSLRRQTVAWSIAQFRHLPAPLLPLGMRLWTRNLFARGDARAVRSVIEEMETLPTVRRGLEALGMRSMLEWGLCAEEIARMKSPYTHPLQRPRFFFPGVSAQAFPPGEPWLASLETAVPAIREELHEALALRRGFQPYRPIGIKQPTKAWNVLYLHLAGERAPGMYELFPSTYSAIEAVPRFRRAGVSCFSAMNPGAAVDPHCGPTNGTLRVHLTIEGAERSTLCVAKQERELVDGRAIVFDDSFEHDVRHDGPRTRFVLLLEIWHPDWSDDEVTALERLHEKLRRTGWSRDISERRRRERESLAGQRWWVD